MPLEEKNTILESQLNEVFSGMSKQRLLSMSPRMDAPGATDTNMLGLDLDIISKTGRQSKVNSRSSRVPTSPWPTSRKADAFFTSPNKTLKNPEKDAVEAKIKYNSTQDAELKDESSTIDDETTFINPNSDKVAAKAAANLWSSSARASTLRKDCREDTHTSVEESFNHASQANTTIGSVSCPRIQLGSDISFVESASSRTQQMPGNDIGEKTDISSMPCRKPESEKASSVDSDNTTSIGYLDKALRHDNSPSAQSSVSTGLGTDSDIDSSEDQDIRQAYTNTVVDFVLENDADDDDGGLRFAPPVPSSAQSHFSKKALGESNSLSSGSSSFIQIERTASALDQVPSIEEKWGTMSNSAYGSDAGSPPDSYMTLRDDFDDDHIPVYPRSRHMSWTSFDETPAVSAITDSSGKQAGGEKFSQDSAINVVSRQMSGIGFGPSGASRTDHSKLKQTHSFATFGSERGENTFGLSNDRIWGAESPAMSAATDLGRGEHRSVGAKVNDWDGSEIRHSQSQQSFRHQYVEDRETMCAQERDTSYAHARNYAPVQHRNNSRSSVKALRTGSSTSSNGHPGNNYARYEEHSDSGVQHGEFKRHNTLPGSSSGNNGNQSRREPQRQHTQPPTQQQNRSISSNSGTFVHTSKHMGSGSSDSLQDFTSSYVSGFGSGKAGFSDSGTFSDSSNTPNYHGANSSRHRYNSAQYERRSNHGNESHRGGNFYNNNNQNEYDSYSGAQPPPQPHNNQQHSRTRRQFSFNGNNSQVNGENGWNKPMRSASFHQQSYTSGNKIPKSTSSPRYNRNVDVNGGSAFMHQNMNSGGSNARSMYSASSDYAPGYPYGGQGVGKNSNAPTNRTAQRSMSLNTQRPIHISQNDGVPKGRNGASRQASELGTATRIQMSRTRGGSINNPTTTNSGASSRFGDNAIVWCDIDQGIEMASSVSSPFVNGRKVLYYFSRRTNRKTIMSLIEPSYLLGTPLENPEVNIGFLTFHDCVELRTLKTGEILTRNQRNNLRKRLATTARTIVQVDVPRLLNDFTDPDCCPRTAYHHSKLNAYLVSPAVIQVLLCTRENEIGAEPYLGHTIQVQTLFDLAKNESATRPLADFIKQSERNSTALNINIRDFKGMCPIHYAAKAGLAGTIDVLIREGADVNVVDKSEQSPLHYAIYNGHKDVQFQLLRAGAKLDTRNVSGNTLLHVAAYHNQLEIAEAILDKAPELLYLRNHKFNSTPLECAGHKTLGEMEQLLGRRMARMSSMGLSGGSSSGGTNWDTTGENATGSWAGQLKSDGAAPAHHGVPGNSDRVSAESSVLSMKMRAPGSVSSAFEMARDRNVGVAGNTNSDHQQHRRVRTVSMHEEIFAANKINNNNIKNLTNTNNKASEGKSGLNKDCPSTFASASNESLACVTEDVTLETDEENYVLSLLMKTSLKVSEGLMASAAGDE